MKKLPFLALLLTGCVSHTNPLPDGLTARSNPDAENLKFINGQWYSNSSGTIEFTRGQLYSVNGIFTDIEPPDYDVIDLKGGYIIPPFGEAHNHSVDGKGTEKAAQKYIDQGVMYYKNTNSIYSFAQPMLPYWAQPATLDVSFSYGGLSKDEGHPEKLYKTLSSFGLYPDISSDAMEGNAFFDVDSLEKLNAKWDAILDLKPDFLKLYLLEHDSDKSDGLNEEMFREIVKRAQAIGIRTSVHVETVSDLALAVDAGATEAAHLPAYNLSIAKDEQLSVIPDDLIKKMALQNFITVATVNVSKGRNYSDEDYKLVADRQANNLKRMYAAGAPIAIGSDTYFETALNEIKTLRAMKVFTDNELLRLWIDTPKLSIFPNRAIGTLAAGYESSFLVLDCDPSKRFECTEEIRAMYKQGSKIK